MANYGYTRLDHLCDLNIDKTTPNYRLTAITCTIGPASRNLQVLENLLQNGMQIARINFSHGTYDYHAETIKMIRTAVENYSGKIGVPHHSLAIAVDTRGPEIRTGKLVGDERPEIKLRKGETLKLTIDKAYMTKGNRQIVYIDYENAVKVLQPGNRIFLNHGQMSLVCKSAKDLFVTCVVETSGAIKNDMYVSLPGIEVDLPAVSDKDILDIKFGIAHDIDIIFASFIRSAYVVKELRNFLGERGKNIWIFSKIENRHALQNLDEIIKHSDGIMIARGDLGIEIPYEKIFLAQKSIIAKCNKYGKPVVCATQILDSMIKSHRPSRAESSDIANAVLDGTDCIMLSGETSKGDYPIQCVQILDKICREAESVLWHNQIFQDLLGQIDEAIDDTHALAIAAVEASIKRKTTAIVVLSESGRSAHLIAKYKPKCPIIMVTRDPKVARQACLFRAIFPICFEDEFCATWIEECDSRTQRGIDYGRANKWIKVDDRIVIVVGWKPGSGNNNTVRIEKIVNF